MGTNAGKSIAMKLPSKTDILQWISDNPSRTSKRDISKAFGITGAARIDLKRLLKELAEDGKIDGNRKTFSKSGELPPVSVLRVEAINPDGELLAKAVEASAGTQHDNILFIPKAGDTALKVGDRFLGKIAKHDGEGHVYEARLIRVINAGGNRLIGIFRARSEGGRVVSIEKGSTREWQVTKAMVNGACEGELVEARQSGPRGRMGLPMAEIVNVLGDPGAPKAISLIAIHEHGIPDAFPQAVEDEVAALPAVDATTRTDLTELPLITIDPSDARDHDDAVCAFVDDNPKNKGGFIVWVAIADVAAYVRSGTELDEQAKLRGNSSYFPDRVVPMLPERLSADLCSLHEGVDRPCIAVRMVLDKGGEKTSHDFHRGWMRSPAALHYEQVQSAIDGKPDDRAAPFVKDVLEPLFAAYRATNIARANRQPLDLDLPERRIQLSDDGIVQSVNFKDRMDAHRVIEEFMVMANVAAAETLEEKKTMALYRVHEEPNPEKLDSLRETAKSAGFALAKGQVLKAAHLNGLLHQAAGTPHSEVINMSVLRSMTQAYYGPDNLSHFGLNLKRYSHFTSPIRRYADLLVHRALISAHGWGDDGLTAAEVEQLPQIAENISKTERRSMAAERDTVDRYLAAFLSERIGGEFEGRISGIAKFGLFVQLDETGADGLVLLSTLGSEYFRFDHAKNVLKGEDTGRVISIGQRVTVRLAEAVDITGGLRLELLVIDGKPIASRKASNSRRYGQRKSAGKGKPRKKISKKR
jgi:ribonuclease R